MTDRRRRAPIGRGTPVDGRAGAGGRPAAAAGERGVDPGHDVGRHRPGRAAAAPQVGAGRPTSAPTQRPRAPSAHAVVGLRSARPTRGLLAAVEGAGGVVGEQVEVGLGETGRGPRSCHTSRLAGRSVAPMIRRPA